MRVGPRDGRWRLVRRAFRMASGLQRREESGVVEERVGLRRSERRCLGSRAQRRVQLGDLRQSQCGYESGASDVGVELPAVDAGPVAERTPDLVRCLHRRLLRGVADATTCLARTRCVDPDPALQPERARTALLRISTVLQPETIMSTYGGLMDMRMSVMCPVLRKPAKTILRSLVIRDRPRCGVVPGADAVQPLELAVGDGACECRLGCRR